MSEDPDELYEPTLAGIEAAAYAEGAAMTDEALYASITEDARGMIAAMREEATAETGWRGIPPEKLLRVAQFLEDALPVHSDDGAYEFAKRLRHVGLMPRGRR